MSLMENNLFSVRESVLSDPILVNGYLIIRAKKISRKDCNYLKKINKFPGIYELYLGFLSGLFQVSSDPNMYVSA